MKTVELGKKEIKASKYCKNKAKKELL